MKHRKQIIIAMLLATAVSSAQALETTIDFEDQVIGNYDSSLTIGNVTFSVEDRAFIDGAFKITALDITEPGVIENDFTGIYLTNGAAGFNELTISFLNPVSQFSFTLGDNQFDWELNAFDTANTSIGTLAIDGIPPLGSNNGTYFGLSSIDSTGISYATLTQMETGIFGSDTIELDNLKYTEVSPVPEPSTYALMLGGLGMVGFMAYRRRKQINT